MNCGVAQKADEKHKEYQEEAAHVDNALSAGICPECGEDLKLKRTPYKSTHTVKHTVGWIFSLAKEVPVIKERVTVVCPGGHNLIHPQWGYRSDPGCCIYGECLDPKIRDYHEMHYGDDDDFGG